MNNESDNPLNEINMSPSALAAFAKTADSYNVRAGFEAELAFAGIGVGMEHDYDATNKIKTEIKDEEISSTARLNDFKEYFRESLGSNARIWDSIEEDYLDAVGDKAIEYVSENFDERAREKVLGDRSLSQRIESNLEADAYSDAEIEDIISAGYSAPEFKHLSDQRKYADKNPNYRHWLNAKNQVDSEIEEEIDSQREDIEQELNDEYWSTNDYYMGQWLRENRITTMSEFANYYDIEWPDYEYSNAENSNFDQVDMESAAEELSELVGTKVVVSNEYHGANRDASSYIIEPDSSINPDDDKHARAEIVSPPMPLSQATDHLKKVFRWARNHGGYTNTSTGLHVGVSIPDMEKVDYVKLALLLGDEYVLKTFGRELNVYCQSVFRKIASNRNPQTIAQAVDALKKGMTGVAANALKYTVFRASGTTEKYISINWKTKYVEFRSMGGDYIDNGDKIITTMYRYVRALVSASEPELDKKEYLTKLYKLIQTANSELNQFDAIEPVNMVIAKYMSGELDKSAIANYKKYFQQIAAARKNPNAEKPVHPQGESVRWRVTDALTAEEEFVMARNKTEALAKAKMQNSRFTDDKQYNVVQVNDKGIPVVLPDWATRPLR